MTLSSWTRNFPGILDLSCFILSHPIFPLLQHLKKRHNIRYWASNLLPNIMYDNVVFVVFYALLEVYLTSLCLMGLTFVGWPLYGYMIMIRHKLCSSNYNEGRKFIGSSSHIQRNVCVECLRKQLFVKHNSSCGMFFSMEYIVSFYYQEKC